MRRLLFCLALSAPASLFAQERYGFVARLGRDTISVERISITGDKLISDEIERFPRVRQRHTEILIGADKSVRRITMDILMPSAVTPAGRERHFTAEVSGDSVHASLRTSDGTRTATVATHGILAMPWVPQMYSLTELYFAAALNRGGYTVTMQQFYPDADIAQFGLFEGHVRERNGKAEVFDHDMLAGEGEATIDAQRRMLSYSGARSTYRQEVTRIATLPDIESIAKEFVATEQRAGVVGALSKRDTARATIGATTFLVDYGRPLARGRELVGNIIQYDEVWRTGANAATQFTTSSPITLGGIALAAGTYTLWTMPSKSGGVELIVNRQTRQWGTQYDDAQDIGRTRLTTSKRATLAEMFTISIAPTDARSGNLLLEWGTFRWTVPIAIK